MTIKTGKALRQALVSALAFLPLSATDSRQVLIDVAERYRSVIDYSLEVRTSVRQGEHGDTGRYTLAASLPDQLYCEQNVPGLKRMLYASDGENAWAYSTARRQYAHESAAGSETTRILRSLHTRFFARFANLDRLQVEARQLRPRKLGGRTCERLELSPGPVSQADWNEVLWIDRESRLVLRSIHTRTTGFPVRVTTKTTTTWKNYRVNQQPDRRLFRLQIPSEATRVNTLPEFAP